MKILLTLLMLSASTAFAGLNYPALTAYWGMIHPNTTPTVRDLNSLPYGKAVYAATNAVQTNGTWYIGDVPISAYADASYTPARPTVVNTNVMSQAERYAYDLARNGKVYVLENQYILLCDQVRLAIGQEATQTPLAEADFPVAMLTLKAINEAKYDTMRDAINLVSVKLANFKQAWMASVRWHTQPELTNSVNAILGMVQ